MDRKLSRMTYWVTGVLNGTVVPTTSRGSATPRIAYVVHAIGLDCRGSEEEKSDEVEKHVEVCLMQSVLGRVKMESLTDNGTSGGGWWSMDQERKRRKVIIYLIP